MTTKTDNEIVALYLERSERAIEETDKKYRGYCFTVANRILSDIDQADESVTDTWICAWRSIPPTVPTILSAYLSKITRRISIDKYRKRTADKRGGGQLPLAIEELGDAVGSDEDPLTDMEREELKILLNRFVRGLSEDERFVFVKRYFYLQPIEDIACERNYSISKIKSMLFRIRKKLRIKLEKEGYI